MKYKALKTLKYIFLTAGKVFLYLFLFLSILLNIFSSQLISPLYFQLVKEDKNAVISFLNKIKNFPVFPAFLTMNKNIYGDSLEEEVFAENKKREEMIAEYEILLQKTPKSRDILYNLYLLYKEDGNKIKAEEYLRRAKEVDPSIDK